MNKWLKYKTNYSKALLKTAVLLLSFMFLFLSTSLKDLNETINDYLFGKLGINMVLYGDINDDDGHANSKHELNQVKEIIYDIKNYLESNNLADVYIEEYLYTNYVYSANKINDPNNYTIIFYDYDSPNYEGTIEYLNDISKDVNNNRQYYSIIENHYVDTSKDDDFNISSYGYVPKIVGVDYQNFSDIKLNSLKILTGRSFTKDELLDGNDVVIVDEASYFINKNEIRQVRVGDVIPLTIDIDGKTRTIEFEVIGITSGKSSDINIQDTSVFELNGNINFVSENYRNMVFIPNNSLNNIYDELNEIKNNYNYTLIKDSNGAFTNSVVYYGQNLGVRPILISINNIDSIKEVSNYLDEKIDELNDASNRIIEYTYYSNFDNYVSIIGSLSTNAKLFNFLSVASCLLFLAVLYLYIITDINSSLKEIAIKISLGQSKKGIIKDIFLEYVVLSIIPIFVSVILAYFINKAYINYINEGFFKLTSGTILFNNYITKIDINPIDALLIFKVLIIWLVSLIISILCAYLKVKNMSIKKILMEGERWY